MSTNDSPTDKVAILQFVDTGCPVSPTDANSVYLGDGIYVTEGRFVGELIIWTDRDTRHWMSLGLSELKGLTRFAREHGWILQ